MEERFVTTPVDLAAAKCAEMNAQGWTRQSWQATGNGYMGGVAIVQHFFRLPK